VLIVSAATEGTFPESVVAVGADVDSASATDRGLSTAMTVSTGAPTISVSATAPGDSPRLGIRADAAVVRREAPGTGLNSTDGSVPDACKTADAGEVEPVYVITGDDSVDEIAATPGNSGMLIDATGMAAEMARDETPG